MAVVGTGAAVYLALAGQGLAAAAVALAVALVIIVFLKSTRRAELGTGKPPGPEGPAARNTGPLGRRRPPAAP